MKSIFVIASAFAAALAVPLPTPLRETAPLVRREANVVTEYAAAVTVTNVVLAYPDGRLVTVTTQAIAEVPVSTSTEAYPVASSVYSVPYKQVILASLRSQTSTAAEVVQTTPTSQFISYPPLIPTSESTPILTEATQVAPETTTATTIQPDTTVVAPIETSSTTDVIPPVTTVLPETTASKPIIPTSSTTQGGQATSAPPTTGDEFTGQATFYDPSVGLTSCGTMHSNQELVAALNKDQYEYNANPNNSASCGKCALVHSNGKSVKVTIVDKCPGCAYGGLDLTDAAFEQLAPLSVGRIPITWSYVDC